MNIYSSDHFRNFLDKELNKPNTISAAQLKKKAKKEKKKTSNGKKVQSLHVA